MKIIKKIIILLPIALLVILCFYIFELKNQLNNQDANTITYDNNLIADNSKDIEYYTVDIKGAIKNPGVYQVPINYNVNDVINLAGGLTSKADTSVINLAKQVSNEMVIIIYTKEEITNSNIVKTVIKVVDQKCVCPNIQNDGCLNNEINDKIDNSSQVNINTASLEELQSINGIGESKAKNIINYREKNGNFNSIEDILNVEGIGQAVYEQIKIYIKT